MCCLISFRQQIWRFVAPKWREINTQWVRSMNHGLPLVNNNNSNKREENLKSQNESVIQSFS